MLARFSLIEARGLPAEIGLDAVVGTGMGEVEIACTSMPMRSMSFSRCSTEVSCASSSLRSALCRSAVRWLPCRAIGSTGGTCVCFASSSAAGVCTWQCRSTASVFLPLFTTFRAAACGLQRSSRSTGEHHFDFSFSRSSGMLPVLFLRDEYTTFPRARRRGRRRGVARRRRANASTASRARTSIRSTTGSRASNRSASSPASRSRTSR